MSVAVHSPDLFKLVGYLLPVYILRQAAAILGLQGRGLYLLLPLLRLLLRRALGAGVICLAAQLDLKLLIGCLWVLKTAHTPHLKRVSILQTINRAPFKPHVLLCVLIRHYLAF